MEPLLTPEELAEYLKVSLSTVNYWRRGDGGPRVTRVGRHPRYAATDVERWLQEQAHADA